MRPLGAVTVGFAIGLALLGLSGCAWSGAGVGVLMALLALLSLACGGQAIADSAREADGQDAGTGGLAGSAGTGGAAGSGGVAGSAGTGGAAGSAGSGGIAGSAGTGGSGGAADCGGGVCPAHMTCGSKAGSPWCLPDADEDQVDDSLDNCPYAFNPVQTDTDGDGVGDACDTCPEPNSQNPCGDQCCSDPDGDDFPGTAAYTGTSVGQDNCPYLSNPDQLDSDHDGVGDACDLSPLQFNPMSPCGDPYLDSDGDGVPDLNYCDGANQVDDCRLTPSVPVSDYDHDGVGDVCDPDGIPPQPAGASSSLPTSEERWNRRSALLQRFAEQGVLDQETVRIASQIRSGGAHGLQPARV